MTLEFKLKLFGIPAMTTTTQLLKYRTRMGMLMGAFALMAAVSAVPRVAAAAEYITYRNNLDLPNPEQVLTSPDNVSLPARADQIYVLGAGILNVISRNNTTERWHAAGKVLEKIVEEVLNEEDRNAPVQFLVGQAMKKSGGRDRKSVV